MKSITCLVAATIAVMFAASAQAQVDLQKLEHGSFLQGRKSFGRYPLSRGGHKPKRAG